MQKYQASVEKWNFKYEIVASPFNTTIYICLLMNWTTNQSDTGINILPVVVVKF